MIIHHLARIVVGDAFLGEGLLGEVQALLNSAFPFILERGHVSLGEGNFEDMVSLDDPEEVFVLEVEVEPFVGVGDIFGAELGSVVGGKHLFDIKK